jgi:hypothetical protein
MSKTDLTSTQDPRRVYWTMCHYGAAVTTALLMLRHLYEPRKALRWICEEQPLLNGRVLGGRCSSPSIYWGVARTREAHTREDARVPLGINPQGRPRREVSRRPSRLVALWTVGARGTDSPPSCLLP